MTHWEDGSYTYEPLLQLKADDPVTVALYAKQKGLLDKPGFKSLKKIANREKKMICMLNQSKLRCILSLTSSMTGDTKLD